MKLIVLVVASPQVPTSGFCFIKSIIYSTGQNCHQSILDFKRGEKRRNSVMIKTRIKHFV